MKMIGKHAGRNALRSKRSPGARLATTPAMLAISVLLAPATPVAAAPIESNDFSTAIGLSLANTVLNGAHGEPMRNMLAPGRKSAWVTTDADYDNNLRSRGGFGLADFGFAMGFEGGFTGRIAVGGIYSKQSIQSFAGGGDASYVGFYVAPEVTLPVAGPIFATLGGYFAPGSVSVDRGDPSFLRGKTDLDTWGAKVRFDWLDAFKVGASSFTPYASLSYTSARMDAYTETSFFTASFDAMREHATIARLGLDMVRTLSDTVRLTARGEFAYRFEDGPSPAFWYLDPIAQPPHAWVRGGVGAEFDVAGGTASLSLNATSKGSDPDVWLRSSWKVGF